MTNRFLWMIVWGTALLLPAGATRAQLLSPRVLQHYPPSVVSRVYEVVLLTILPHNRQDSLARFFLRKDSLINAALLQGEDAVAMEKQVAVLQTEMETLLGEEGRRRYLNRRYLPFMEADAKLRAAAMRQNYHASAAMERYFYNLEDRKNLSVFHTLLAAKGEPAAGANEREYFARYDSLNTIYVRAARGEAYFTTQLAALEAIKPLTGKQKNTLYLTYTDNCLRRNDDYYKNFAGAVKMAARDTVYMMTLFKDSIDNGARERCRLETDAYAYLYGVPDSVLKKIEPLLLDKARQHVMLDLQVPYSRARDSIHTRIEVFAGVKVKRELIRFGCFTLSDSRLAHVMRYQRYLNMSGGQMDSLALQNQAKELADYQYKITCRTPRKEEEWEDNGFLQRILRPAQFDSLLEVEAIKPAKANAARDWWNLTRLKMADGLDSATALAPVVQYYMTCQVIGSRYATNRQTYAELMRTARQHKPLLLQQLEAALKKEYETITGKPAGD